MGFLFNDPSRVTDDQGDVIGILWFNDYYDADDSALVTEVMRNVEPHEFLNASTSIFDAVEVFGRKRNDYFYVTEINEVIGVLNFRDLFRPVGRLAFLALTLEIEDEALTLCQHPPIREKRWEVDLREPPEQGHRAIRLRYEREPNSERDVSRLIECTHLADKATMIWKQRLLDNTARSEVLGLFKKLRMVRDRCAHPGGDARLLPREELADFIASANSVRKNLRECNEAAWRRSKKAGTNLPSESSVVQWHSIGAAPAQSTANLTIKPR